MGSVVGRAILAAGVIGAATGTWAQSVPHKAADAKPSEPSPLRNEIVDKYMTGDWNSLEMEITQKQKDISALPKDQFADVRYIVQAVNECDPVWWKQTRSGGRGTIRATVWQRNVSAEFQNGGSMHMDYRDNAGKVTISLTWPSADMESDAPAEHGFTKGDLAGVGVWGLIEQASLWNMIPGQRLVAMQGAEKTTFDRFTGFRSITTAAYYGRPRAREWAVFLGLDAYVGDHQSQEGFMARKPLGAMFMAEVAGHPEEYPDLKLPESLEAEDAESQLATDLMQQLGNAHWSFEEDKALRQAVRQFGLVNGTGVFTSGRISFANKQVMGLDPRQDAQAAPRRNKWLADALANGGDPAVKHAAKSTSVHTEKADDTGIPWRP